MIDGIIFDKDGTLSDFTATWSIGTPSVFSALVGDDIARKRALGSAIGFDFDRGTFTPGSVGVTGPESALLDRLAPLVPELDRATLETVFFDASSAVVQQPVLELEPFFRWLSGAGYRLGVVTNDAEGPARRHLHQFGVLQHLDFVAGFDSGHGAKPAPGPLNAFAKATGLSPEAIVMVGDSHFDLEAAAAAGMRAIGVLTGAATEAELSPLAEAVLPDIGHLPRWLGLA